MFAESWTLGLEAHSRCKKCHFILPFNGPVTLAVCAKCGEKRELDRKQWDELLDMPAKLSRVMRAGTTKECQVGMGADALVLKITREEPRCRACQRELDPSRPPEKCRNCNASLGVKPAPDIIKHTQRAAERTILGAEDGDGPFEEAKRWYIWFHVEPSEVEADRKRAAEAVAKIESKLPKVRALPAPVLPRLPEAPKPDLVKSSPYRGRAAAIEPEVTPEIEPQREPEPKDQPESNRPPQISRNVALVLMLVALGVGFFLGRSV